MDKAELIQVIRTSILRRGKGIDSDPTRIITQFWSLSGDLLAEVDPWNPSAAVLRKTPGAADGFPANPQE